MNKKQILIITGPTGVGKTDLVLKLAATMPCEIINIDIGQFYEPFAIGTAKPEWDYLSKGIKIAGGISHHLFDILDTPRSLTVHEYRNIVLETINKVWANNKLPILVGGSGFYIQSLLFPLQDLSLPAVACGYGGRGDTVIADAKTTRDVGSEAEFFGAKNKELWDILYSIDPDRAENIDKQDEYRIKRALEIWQKTGRKPSECLPQFDPPCDFTFLVVDRNRDDLYNRINQRVLQMIDQGWIDEIKKIKGTDWESFLKIKKLIGYDDTLNYLDSENKDRDVLIEIIQQKTRKYAKRQLTFFRMLSSKILVNACYPSIHCAKHSTRDACIKTKVIWTNLTLLTDLNTLFASLKNSPPPFALMERSE